MSQSADRTAMAQDALLPELSALSYDLVTAGALRGNRVWRSAGRVLARIERCLARPLRLAVFGEEKAGKSSLINFLLKREALPSGGLPGQGTYLLVHYASEPVMYAIGQDGARTRLTSKAVKLIATPEPEAPHPLANVIYDATNPVVRPASHASTVAKRAKGSVGGALAEAGKLIELGLPHDLLRAVEMVEAREFPTERLPPGIARAFQPIDIAVWCTLATQAWKESERAAWRAIPAGRRRMAVMLVTYKDAIRNPMDEAKILARLRKDTRGLFDEVVLASLRDALEAETGRDNAAASRLRAAANAEAVERALSALADRWKQERRAKALRLMQVIAAVLRRAEKRGGASAAGRSLIAHLERIIAAAHTPSDDVPQPLPVR